MFDPHTISPARGLGHEFRVPEQMVHGPAEVVVRHPHHLVDEAPADAEGVGQRVGRPQAVRHGVHAVEFLRLARLKAAVHGVGAEGLDPVDRAGRIDLLHRRRNAGAQAAAAHRHDHGLEPRHLFHELEAHGRGALDGERTLEGMDQRPRLLALDLPAAVEGRVDVGHENDGGAQVPAARDARGTRALRHHHRGAGSHQPRRVGHGDGVIARAHRHHAAAPGLRIERGHAVEGAAQFERPGGLKKFELQPDFGAAAEAGIDDAGSPAPYGGLLHAAGQPARRLPDLLEGRMGLRRQPARPGSRGCPGVHRGPCGGLGTAARHG